MCTIADAKVRQNYNCYNVYFNECLRLCLHISLLLSGCGQAHLYTELLTCQSHLLQESLAGVQTGVSCSSSQSGSIYIALPVPAVTAS